MCESIPVVDLFAGPGGLAEGFSSLRRESGEAVFRLSLSIEKDPVAHRTLRLRSLFRHLRESNRQHLYYQYVRGERDWDSLTAACDAEFTLAQAEAWRAELGVTPHQEVRKRVNRALANGKDRWVLIGGPPCQAYSLVGRSRMRKADPAAFEADHRHFLYREYLRILAEHAPPVFIMENVKGLLSSKVNNEAMFDRICNDLRIPGEALELHDGPQPHYELFGLGSENGPQRAPARPMDFVVRAEQHGVPQRRHRVIVLGVRSDLINEDFVPLSLDRHSPIALNRVIGDLPELRSGISGSDSREAWNTWVRGAFERLATDSDPAVEVVLRSNMSRFSDSLTRGSDRIFCETKPRYLPDWYHDPDLGLTLHHQTRGHMAEDLDRYLFSSCFAQCMGRSPSLRDFPERILPDHLNIERALAHGVFNDRFRVQLWHEPSTTITSHISKDGHYYIHPDPLQCRSLTVREAARLQTFPDNYWFEGPRTSQYTQVGNAVPPILASKIATVVQDVFSSIA